MYTPDRVLVTHDYHGHQSNPVVHTWGQGKKRGSKHFQETSWKWLDDINSVRANLSIFGSMRVNRMLGFGRSKPNDEDEIKLMRKSRFGIGTKRTLEQAEAFSGIDFKKKKMVVNRCGNLEWVPYKESPNYGIEEVLSRGFAGEKVRPYVLSSGISHSVRQVELAELSLKASKSLAPKSNTNYRFLGGLLLVVLALVLMILKGGKKKDKEHKK